jgi:hypothetical protein
MLRRKEQSPLFCGNVELEIPLALHTTEGKCVPIDSTEEIWLGWDTYSNVRCVRNHFL